MTDSFNRYLTAVQAMNPRLTIGGGVLILVMAGQGLLAYLQPFA